MQLKEVAIKRLSSNSEYPFSIPIIQKFKKLEFKSPVTIVVGENGTGKSSLLEAIAIASNLPTVGATESGYDRSLEPAKKLAKQLQLSWGVRNHRGFFMRAEDFFGFQKKISETQAELRKQKQEFTEKFEGYGQMLATGSTQNQLDNLEKRYGENPDAFSHGESFLNLFAQRLVPEGLYILDEPEVPLSPKRQLSLISMIKEQVEKDSQFIIATHAPILMAIPNATIIEIVDGKINEVKYEDLEHVTLMKDFLNNPERYLQYL